ncbi:MAG: signal peptidase I [Lachnospiraceae bacterium]|nr:signal peptidase I [Lachnospiraceae bacterium]
MKKACNIIKNVIVCMVTILAICMMIFTVISVCTFDRNDRSLFGYKAFIVLSDSMSATDFGAGDLILVKEIEPEKLKAGDIIAYISQNSDNYGETITHKIRSLTTDTEGNPGFITYGTTTGVDDEKIVTYPYILGLYQFRLPKVGTFFHFLKTVPGYILLILIPFLILILFQGMNLFRVFRQYRAEQKAELEAEWKKLEEEKLESQRMKQELEELRAQLAMREKEGQIEEGQS